MKVGFSFACDKRWDDMSGDDQKRLCAACDKHVHNLSAMRPETADQLLRGAKPGDLCVTAVHDREHNVIFDGKLFRLAAAAGLFAVSPAAMADGSVPTLANTATDTTTTDTTASNTDTAADTATDAHDALQDVDDDDCDKPAGENTGDLTDDLDVYITGGVYIDPGPPLNVPTPVANPARDVDTASEPTDDTAATTE